MSCEEGHGLVEGNVDACDGLVPQAYIKASNADALDLFGGAVAISGDTLVVGAPVEASNQTTVTQGSGASGDNSLFRAGAAYVFRRTGQAWVQEAYLKAPNADTDNFGGDVAIDGDTIAVAAIGEASNQTTITNGATASADESASGAGAVYVFRRTGSGWAQEAYIKAPNAEALDRFGGSIALSGDTLVVGSYWEDSNEPTITNGATASADNSALGSGAAYVFRRTAGAWEAEAYLKPSNTEAGDCFGIAVSISGETIVVGASKEDANDTAIANGATASTNNDALDAGAAYVFTREGTTWSQQAYLKAPNSEAGDQFGSDVAVFGDTVVIGAYGEDAAVGQVLNGATASANNGAPGAGAAYVFRRTGSLWAQEAYLKAGNPDIDDNFGYAVAVSGDVIAIGALYEDSAQATIGVGAATSTDNSLNDAGAAYLFERTGTSWIPKSYIKAGNAGAGDSFGIAVGIDGRSVAVGAYYEDSSLTTITEGAGTSTDDSAKWAGAAYVFTF